MRGNEFSQLSAFVAIADHGSFVKAAGQLGISPSALSQSIRNLETRLGMRLLNRTTRSVALTDAGRSLLHRVQPALSELGEAVEVLNRFRDRPTGKLRINAPRIVAMMSIAPLLGRFLAAYPDIVLEVTVDNALTDIVAAGFDAGIRLGERLEQDMIAVKLGGELRLVAVASPEYLARQSRPRVPEDLRMHRCINWRENTSGRLYRWEFEKDGQACEVEVTGSFVANDVDLIVRAAADGVGIAYLLEPKIAPFIASGQLVPLLEDWSPRFPGMFLYYPSRRQMPASLRCFIDCLREELEYST